LAFTPLSEQSITPEKIKLLSILCQQCSLVMSNTLLYQNLLREQESLEQANREIKRLSRIDPLTGCYNRGYLMERLPEEIKRSGRYNRPLSLIMCDIDHFKQVNDTYGHRVGDKILQAFVRCMADGIRKGIDWLARYGGEEFIVILPETTTQGAIVLANRLCKAVASRSIRLTDQNLSITASFGVTGFSTSDTEMELSAGRMIETADRNLYAAKQAGRNTVKGTPLS
jgi:diguanylate cyclase (GGDEF)-like protein